MNQHLEKHLDIIFLINFFTFIINNKSKMFQLIMIVILSILFITFISLYFVCRTKLQKEVDINNELYDKYNLLAKKYNEPPFVPSTDKEE